MEILHNEAPCKMGLLPSGESFRPMDGLCRDQSPEGICLLGNSLALRVTFRPRERNPEPAKSSQLFFTLAACLLAST